ncbi:MAG TPA: hypothetical protein GXX17_00925 [Clostridiales bacterium]|nr:hypothetical protein [Clostridiales bacterium]
MFQKPFKNIKFTLLCGLILPEPAIMVLLHFNIGGSITLTMRSWAETVALCVLAMLAFLYSIKMFIPVYIIYYLSKILIRVWDIISGPADQGLVYQIVTSAGSLFINFGVMFLFFAVILQIIKFYCSLPVTAACTVLGLTVSLALAVFLEFLLKLIPLGYSNIFTFTYVYLTKNPGKLVFPAGILTGLLLANHFFDRHKKPLQR